MTILFLFAFGYSLFLLRNYSIYKKGSYFEITKVPYFTLQFDKGRFGEYLIYKRLRRYEREGGKFLFNLYIPKENNETTEIDVLLISPKGLFVFESKNYSGWIFGTETQRNWTQTLPQGRGRSHKEHFYNPIMQNKGHMKHLSSLVGSTLPMYSIIVFSERCTLKSIKIQSENIRVVNRNNVSYAVSSFYKKTDVHTLSSEKINELYKALYSFTQVSDEKKEQHINTINKEYKINGF